MTSPGVRSATSANDPLGPVAPITRLQALGLLVAYCFVYVSPLYAFSATRPSPTRSRDAPESIRPRIRAVSFSTAACSLATLLFLTFFASGPATTSPAVFSYEPLHAMGYWPVGLTEAASALVLTGLLFAGPLYECLIIDGVWYHWVRLEPLKEVWSDWPTWRNMVAGPVTEECLFRSAAVPILLLAGSSLNVIIFLSPLIFGLAHLHHFYEFRVTHPHVPLSAAIARSVLQLSYTSLFGAYATFLFLRTGSLLAVIAVHTFCNSMGLPRVWGRLEPHWLHADVAPRPSNPIRWTVIYYALLVGGAMAWWQNLYTLTQSAGALANF